MPPELPECTLGASSDLGSEVHTARGSVAEELAFLSVRLLLRLVFEFVVFAFAVLDVARLDTGSLETILQLLTLLVLPAGERRAGMNLEAVDLGFVATDALLRDQSGVDLEEDVVERSSKVGSVNGGVARGLRVVDILALGAIQLDRVDVGQVGQAHGEKRLLLAQDTGTLAKVALLVLIQLHDSG